MTIGLLYVNLVTATLMCAAIGLLHPLVPPADKSATNAKGSGSAAQVLVAMAFFFGLQAMIVQGRAILENSLAGALLGAFTPVAAMWGLLEGSAWQATVPFWSVHLPSLLVAPVLQLAVTACIVTGMSRKLSNPLNPPLTKPIVYALTASIDLFAAGLLYSSWKEGLGFSRATAAFFAAHLVTALLLASLVTPSREVLMTWLWRLRGRAGMLRDGVWLDRSPNLLVLVVLAVIGPLVYFVGFVAPVVAAGSVPLDGGPPRDIVPPLATATVLLLSLGTLLQCVAALVRRGATLAFICLLVVLFCAPPMAAGLIETMQPLADVAQRTSLVELIVGLTPPVHFVGWIAAVEHVPLLRLDALARTLPAMLACYAALFVFCVFILSRWLAERRAVVAGKLAHMNVSGRPNDASKTSARATATEPTGA
ncbi:MAG: hypothetical protein R3C10_23170 [Pirellulales bacterium]